MSFSHRALYKWPVKLRRVSSPLKLKKTSYSHRWVEEEVEVIGVYIQAEDWEGQRCDKMGIIRDEWTHEKKKKKIPRLYDWRLKVAVVWHLQYCAAGTIWQRGSNRGRIPPKVRWFSCFSETQNVRIQCLFFLISEPISLKLRPTKISKWLVHTQHRIPTKMSCWELPFRSSINDK